MTPLTTRLKPVTLEHLYWNTIQKVTLEHLNWSTTSYIGLEHTVTLAQEYNRTSYTGKLELKQNLCVCIQYFIDTKSPTNDITKQC